MSLLAWTPARRQSTAVPLTDREFWQLSTDLSEPGGVFAQQLMSNEDSAQFVLPALSTHARPGGTFIGVGSEQNFTYLAALRPRIAFVVDIRRDNLLEMLMYKAIFELSTDRADFVSRLFSRKRPAGVDARSTVTALFDAYDGVAPDAALLQENGRALVANLTVTHGFAVTQPDQAAIVAMLAAFRTAGPKGLKGFGDRDNLTYAQLMAGTDLSGREHSFLASEVDFRTVQNLQRMNLVVPVVGDFSGTRALAGIGAYLAGRRAVVDVFYVSNVERYLFEQGEHGRQFYSNVAALPLAGSSVFIRSVTRDISQRLGIALPAQPPSKWWTFLFGIQECLAGFRDSRIQGYADLFKGPI